MSIQIDNNFETIIFKPKDQLDDRYINRIYTIRNKYKGIDGLKKTLKEDYNQKYLNFDDVEKKLKEYYLYKKNNIKIDKVDSILYVNLSTYNYVDNLQFTDNRSFFDKINIFRNVIDYKYQEDLMYTKDERKKKFNINFRRDKDNNKIIISIGLYFDFTFQGEDSSGTHKFPDIVCDMNDNLMYLFFDLEKEKELEKYLI